MELRRVLVSCLLLTACRTAPTPAATPGGGPTPREPGFDVTALDRSVKPCDDFYQFACGGWLARTPIPADRPSWSRSMSVINERNEQLLHTILDEYAAGHYGADEPDARKVGDFYAACLDEPAVESAAREALADWNERISKVRDVAGLAALVRWMQDRGFNVLFDFGAEQDFRDATQVIGQADQGGLGLPDRDYYLADDARKKKIREAYRGHVARMLELAGDSAAAAEKAAGVVLELETELARVSMSRVDRRDPLKIYHRIDRPGLEAAAPHFPWARYFTDNLADVKAVNVLVPAFFEGMDKLIDKTPLDRWKTYLRWHAVADHASALGQRFVDEDFAFTSKNLTGTEKILPRWNRCMRATDRALGEALAQPYVKRTFGADGKARAQSMIGDIERAFTGGLDGLAWMDAPTRAAALDKARKLFNKIGYPDKWRRYDTVTVDRQHHVSNVLSASAFEAARQYAKIGKPVDRGEWDMTPPTVNAYYNPLLNEMVFPAGILQTPLFSREAPAAANYGAIGMVMGHELTHGFDDEGRQFDAQGNLREWWTPAVVKAYEGKASCVADQYDGYIAIEDLHVNGKLTLGENIADMGGIKLAYEAFQARHTQEPAVEGFTEDQRFFLGFAQAWCTKRRPEMARNMVTVDPHSPAPVRVDGPLRNLPAFARAWSCSAGASMAPANACQVW
jgi:putative endopeptidase